MAFPNMNRRELQERVDELLNAELRYVARIRALEEALLSVADLAAGVRKALEGLLDPDGRLPGEPEPRDMRSNPYTWGDGDAKS